MANVCNCRYGVSPLGMTLRIKFRECRKAFVDMEMCGLAESTISIFLRPARIAGNSQFKYKSITEFEIHAFLQ
jgi:hypothetical protein